jgi:O-methyltransferase involved in polyketide biosynthesis
MTRGRATAEVPPGLDTSRPHPARIYDYALGGKNHFAADRELADRALARVPAVRTAARENRAFVGRAVRYLAEEAGVRQFLDIGAGLPTTVNVHEVAQMAAPESRIVYVDSDPMVLTHARALLTSSPQGRVGYVQADLRDPADILDNPVTREVIDFDRPVALLLAAVLHYLQDEDSPGKIVATLMDALPPGSFLVASHVSGEHDPDGWAAVWRDYRAAGIQVRWRDGDEFARQAFAGLEMIPPGLVLVSEWRPDTDGPRPAPAEVSVYGGTARKQ